MYVAYTAEQEALRQELRRARMITIDRCGARLKIGTCGIGRARDCLRRSWKQQGRNNNGGRQSLTCLDNSVLHRLLA